MSTLIRTFKNIMMIQWFTMKLASAATYYNRYPDIDTDSWVSGTEYCRSVGYVPQGANINAQFSDRDGHAITWELDYVKVVYWFDENNHPYYFTQHRKRSDYYVNKVNYKDGEEARTGGDLGICVNQRWGHDEIYPLHGKTWVDFYS